MGLGVKQARRSDHRSVCEGRFKLLAILTDHGLDVVMKLSTVLYDALRVCMRRIYVYAPSSSFFL